MVTYLHQLLAVEKGIRQRTHDVKTAFDRDLGKPEPLSGISRTYRPLADEGTRHPDQFTKVQYTVPQLLGQLAEHTIRMVDVVAAKDITNCYAKADVVVDGVVLAMDVPATHLLFLEKQLTDLRTAIRRLPTLDPARKWEWDANAGAWAATPEETTKNKKVYRNHVLYDATKEHPAQVQPYTEEAVEGYWTTIRFSGALPADTVYALTERCDALLRAVKSAREQANRVEVSQANIGGPLMGYLFRDVI